MVQDQILTIDEVATEFKVGRKAILAEIAAGRLSFFWIGKRRRFERSDLDAYMKARKETGCPSTARKAARSSSTTSRSKVIGFTEARERRLAAKRARKTKK